jgi:hypothetical protein
MSIEQKDNFSDTFLRDVTVALLHELHEKLTWTNTFSNESRKVIVPFYYSLTGDDRFLMDAFVDDIPGKRIEQNYDKVPRGVISLESTAVRSNELTNPNVKVNRYVEENEELRRVVSKMRSLPITLAYEIRIRVASEIDLFKCQQAIWNLIYQYQYFYFDHNFLRLEAFFRMPDELVSKINRDVNMQSDIYMEKTFRLEVKTAYPLFGEIERIPSVNKVTWQNNIWKLSGSGATSNDDISKTNSYPAQNDSRSNANRSDQI